MVEIVDSNAMQWYQPKSEHRDDGVEFKHLFTGVEGEADNYWFTLVQVRERYHTPPHRHMFDQVRFMIDGGFNFGPQEQPEGSVGYFTEGTTYEQSCDSYSFHLLLQCEGGSRTKYFSGKSLREATKDLKQIGQFADGRYTYADGREVDGYEAIYEQLTGEMPNYTAPRYERPVIMDPASFNWVDVAGQLGVKQRKLGSFNERDLALNFLSLAAGASFIFDGAAAGQTLAYVVKGSGMAGDLRWTQGCGLRLSGDETAALTADADAEIFMITMPRA
jgi:hypothetical protein